MSTKQFWNDVPRIQKRPFISDRLIERRPEPAKSRISSFLHTTWTLFTDYSYCSTVHGFRYMGERNRTLFERTWWGVVVFISLIVCGHLIMNVYKKFRIDPVIVTFSDQETPIWQIPFPAVTICPQTKTIPTIINITDKYHQFRRHRDYLYTLDKIEFDRMTALSQVCEARLFGNLDPKNKTNCRDCVKNLREMAIPFNDMFLLCTYRNKLTKCAALFEEVITAEGVCYTFNGLNTFRNVKSFDARWSLEDGYKFGDLLNSYPRRALGAGAQFGFFMVLGICRHDFDYLCRGPVQSFKLVLHMPIEYPQATKHFLRVPLTQETIFIVKPKMIGTSEGVRRFPVESRNCFFFHERYLRFFRGYTQRNCELECLANYTLKKCGCNKFHMPPIPGIPQCGADKISCCDLAEDEILQHQIMEKVQHEQFLGCNCLPSCTSISYDTEISQADFNANAYLAALGMDLKELAALNVETQASNRITKNCSRDLQTARLIIFFKDEQFMAIRRSKMYSSNEFLADCGGLLGLFMGVSLMSFLEIVYFATIRLYFNLKMWRGQKKVVVSSQPRWSKPI